MMRIKEFWRNLVDYLKWQIEQDYPIEWSNDTSDKAAIYERLETHYPNILARLNAAVDKKEKK